MRLLPHIFGCIVFVRAEFAAEGSYRTEVFLRQKKRYAPAEHSDARCRLTVLVLCGHGVVTKPDGSEISARVTSDPKTFLWSSVAGCTSFVRRERVRPLLDELAAEGIAPVRIFCTDAAASFDRTMDEFASRLYADFRIRTLFLPIPEGSAAAQAAVRRAALPVLGAFLCILAVNALLSPRLHARREMLRNEIAARERFAATAVTADGRRKELLEAFSMPAMTSWAVVCDRIGEAVPAQVVLASLEIEPLVKRFEAGKPLVRRERTAVIRGTAPAAEDISAFVQRLAQTDCCRDVRLVGVEKERDADRLVFRIETAL